MLLILTGAIAIPACGTAPFAADPVGDGPRITPSGLPNLVGGGRPGDPALTTRFGNQSVPRGKDDTHEAGYAVMRDLGMSTLREGWNWKYIEVSKHKNVSWMDYFDKKAERFAQMGVKVQAMVTDTPDWASSDPKYASKTGFDANSPGKYTVPAGLNLPIFSDGTDVYKPGVKSNPDNYFADYLFDMATRYRGQIQYWQIWNEPDYPSGDLQAGAKTSDGRQRYWTGSVQDYVRLLQVGHTIVKGIDPQAKITLGGLGYEGYLAAILDHGGARYFDVVDFHAYGSDASSSNGVLNSDWGFLGRYRAMKRMLEAKRVSGKTFACSETGFTSDNGEEQARYVPKLFAAAIAQGDVEAVQWAVFTNPGHRNMGLIDQATLSKKTPGYHAYQVATGQLTGARFEADLTSRDVQGYRFKRADGKPLYVLWATGTKASLTVPLGSGQVLDKLGKPKRASFAQGALSLELDTDPVYVVGS
jgi:hypothetical protein